MPKEHGAYVARTLQLVHLRCEVFQRFQNLLEMVGELEGS
jgi:hypothetical protein